MNHRIGRMIFGFGVGFLVAILSYRWIIDTAPRAERQLQETVVIAARELITSTVNAGTLEVVDPLAPNRVVGKTYVYPTEGGWEVSGFYRRDEVDLWHPYLLTMDDSMALIHAKVSDKQLLPRMSEDPRLEVLP